MAYDEEFDPETDYMSDEEQQDSPVPQPMPAPVQVPVVPQQAPSQPVAAPERTAYLENYDPATGIRNRTAVPYVPRQAPAAPLVDINWRALQNVQADQAAKAVAIAMQYQGMRGYQAELAKGTPAAQALAKWAPAMFYGSPAAGSAVARAIQPAPEMQVHTLPDGQQVATFHNTVIPIGLSAARRAALQLQQQREQRLVDSQKQRSDLLNQAEARRLAESERKAAQPSFGTKEIIKRKAAQVQELEETLSALKKVPPTKKLGITISAGNEAEYNRRKAELEGRISALTDEIKALEKGGGSQTRYTFDPKTRSFSQAQSTSQDEESE